MLSLVLLELALQDILADVPHDAGAMVVYTLMLLFVGFTWYGSRGGRKNTEKAESPDAI